MGGSIDSTGVTTPCRSDTVLIIDSSSGSPNVFCSKKDMMTTISITCKMKA